jgi:hypothetical protein
VIGAGREIGEWLLFLTGVLIGVAVDWFARGPRIKERER